MDLKIEVIPALTDNYIFVLVDPSTHRAVVIDPAENQQVQAFISNNNLQLTHILNTHHHYDHIGGNYSLKSQFGAKIIAPVYDRERIPHADQLVAEGDSIDILSTSAHVLFIPGHTRGHIAYWFKKESLLFVGDTLFSLGCGRLFEGTPEQMFTSLERIKQLPPQTTVYCAHEYTQTNGHFAHQYEPNNLQLQQRMSEVRQLRAQSRPTVPTMLHIELATNPFLRPHSHEIRQNLNMPQASELEVFTRLRQLKDEF